MKMIIADVDGTLIHQKVMSDMTKKTIQDLQQQGYIFSIATGRHKDATKSLVKDLNVDYPVICTNGALIYDFKHHKIIHQDVIDSKSVTEVLSILNQNDTSFLLYTTQMIVSTQTSKDKLESRIGAFDSLVVKAEKLNDYLSIGLVKILIIESDPLKFNHLKTNLSNIENVYVLSSQPTFIDVGNKNASKGRSLEVLCQYLDISLSDVLSIGDQENDLTMIEKAGLGVAMGNGEDVLKQKADFITKPVEEDGFTYAIHKLIFKK